MAYCFEKLRCTFIHCFKGRGLICSTEIQPCCIRQLHRGPCRLRRTRACLKHVLCRITSSLDRRKSSTSWGMPPYPSPSKNALAMAINWFWDTLQCKWPDPKASILLASKGTSSVSRVSVLRLVLVLYMHLGHISSVTKHVSCDPALISKWV